MVAQRRIRKAASLRREEILDEAIRQIGRLGYHGFTIRELSSACGISNAGMLHYFGSKLEMLIAVIDRLEQHQAAALQPYIDQCSAGKATMAEVRGLLTAMMRQILDSEELSRLVVVIQAESLDPAHPAHESFRRRESAAVAFIEQLLTGLVGAPGVLARGLHATMNGLAQQWLREGEDFDVMNTWELLSTRLLPEAEDRHAHKKTP